MGFAGGIWALPNILVPSTKLSIQEFRSSRRESGVRSQESGVRRRWDYTLLAFSGITVS
jgi:hypothetical protein